MLAFAADVHLGNPSRMGGPVYGGVNERGRQVLDALDGAYAIALQKAEAFIVLGDLFDSSRTRPQWIAAAQQTLSADRSPQTPNPTGMNTIALLGNHDQESESPGDNALAPLKLVDGILVVETPDVYEFETAQLLLLPFRTGDAAEWFGPTLSTLVEQALPAKGRMRILGFHLGVKDDTTVDYLADSPDSIHIRDLQLAMATHGIHACVAGNWHDHRRWNTSAGPVVQCGALAPTGWANPGMDYGHVVLIDTEKRTIQTEQVEGPRFLKAKSIEDAEKQIEDSPDHAAYIYVELKVPPADLNAARAWVGAAQASGSIHAGEAIPDESGAKMQAQKAGFVARSAETLDEAVAGFVSQMPLAEGVDRADVLNQVKQYTRVR